MRPPDQIFPLIRNGFFVLGLLLLCLPARADVAPLDDAVSGGTAGTATSMSYTVSAGTDRYLISAYTQDNDGGEPSATYGDVTGTLLRTCDTGDGNLRLTIFGWTDAQIASAANTIIAWSVNDALNQIMARSYQGVDQASPVTETDCDVDADGDTPNPLTTSSIAAGDDSYVLSAIGVGIARTISWANVGELLDEATSSSTLSIADVAVPAAATINPQPTVEGASANRWMVVSLELAPAPPSAFTYYAPPIVSGIWPGRYDIQAQLLPDATEEETYAGATLVPLNGQPSYTWSLTGGALPGGLTLGSSTGTISGAPNAATAGVYNFTVEASDAGSGEAYQSFSITVDPATPGGGSLSIYEDGEDADELTANPVWTTPGGCSDTANGFMEGSGEVTKTTATPCVLADDVNEAKACIGFDFYRNGTATPDTDVYAVVVGKDSGGNILYQFGVESDSATGPWELFAWTPSMTANAGRGFFLGNLDADQSKYIEMCFQTGTTGDNALFEVRVDGANLQTFTTGMASANVDQPFVINEHNDDAAQDFFFDRVEVKDDDWPGRGALGAGGGEDPPAEQPWITNFVPARTHYVTVNGSGVEDGTITDPESWAEAFGHYQCGDLHVLRTGNYKTDAATTTFSTNCPSNNQTVFKAYVDPATWRMERAKFDGPLRMEGDWIWFVNIEVLQTHDQRVDTFGLRSSSGVRFINGIGGPTANHNIFGFWDEGSDQLLYGTVLLGAGCEVSTNFGHNIYTQNDLNTHGWKYIIQNLFVDQCHDGGFVFHGYTTNGNMNGFHLEKNLFANPSHPTGGGSVLFQNVNGGVWQHILKENIFLELNPGSTRGVRCSSDYCQMQVTDNYFAKANFVPEALWGAVGSPPQAFVFTGNEIYDPSGGNHIQNLVTDGPSGTPGTHKLWDDTVWDNNVYGGTFRAQLHANGTNFGNQTLAQWRTNTDASRETPASAVGFDINSTNPANPTTPKIFVFQNEYQCPACTFQDQDRGQIVIANWPLQTGNITVDISSVVGVSRVYSIRYAKDFWGTLAASGTCPGAGACNVSLPTKLTNAGSTGAFTLAYVIEAERPPESPPEDPPAEQPWIHDFTADRIHYIDDVSCGGNGDIGTPECLADAGIASHYTAGDLHIFRAGTYNIETIFGAGTRWELSENCSEASPCVWRAFVSSTGQPENADINGSTRFTGNWHWFTGLNLGGDTTTNSGHMEMRAGGIHAIHNVFEGCSDSCMEPWNEGSDQIMYGNVVASTSDSGSGGVYAWYTQNDFASNGWKYFIQNIVHSIALSPTPTSFLVHAYTEGGFVSGMHFEDNYFGDATSRNIFSPPSATPGQKLIWKRNYMLDVEHSGIGLRTSRVACMEITDSYFARSNFAPEAYWGNVGTHDPCIFTGNEIYDPPDGNHIRLFQTTGTSQTAGNPKILDADEWDDNTYGGTFQAQLHCNGTNSGNRTLAQWRTSTDACRVTPASAVGFDINSTEVANPTVNKIVILQSEYFCPACTFQDSDWGNIYIANWEDVTSDVVDISSVVGLNKQYVVRYADDFYGTAAASGTCPGTTPCNVTLPTKHTDGGGAGQFALAYVVTGQP